MQQYFIDTELTLNQETSLRDDILYHLKKVLRGTNETFRLCDSKGEIYLASLKGDKALMLIEALSKKKRAKRNWKDIKKYLPKPLNSVIEILFRK